MSWRIPLGFCDTQMFVSVHRVSVHLLVRVFGSMLDLFHILIFAGYRVNGVSP
jgi:hypothetical protein